MGLAKLGGGELGAAGSHLCSHEGKVTEANTGWGGEKASREIQTPNNIS